MIVGPGAAQGWKIRQEKIVSSFFGEEFAMEFSGRQAEEEECSSDLDSVGSGKKKNKDKVSEIGWNSLDF